MLDRFFNILLIILVIIAFFFGVRIGKNIQRVDTPERLIYKTKKITPSPVELKRYTISSCSYSFIVPSNLEVTESSQSAVITGNNSTLSLRCSLTPPTDRTNSYIQVQNGRYLIFSGEKKLLNTLKEGFVTDSRYRVLP